MNNVGHFKHLVESMERRALGEDWGSSDWYPILKNMEEYIEARGMSPENVENAARHQAEYYFHDMGYESPEAAVDSIVSAWLRMSEQGKAWSKMFAPIEEDRQPLGDTRLTYDLEFDNEDITIFTLGGKPVLEMPLDDWMALISKFNRVFRGKEGPR